MAGGVRNRPGGKMPELTTNASAALNRRRLRVELKRARIGAQLSQRDAAALLNWPTMKLLRIETGQSGVSRGDLLDLLRLYRVRDRATIEQLIGLAQEGRRLFWDERRDVLQPEFSVYLG